VTRPGPVPADGMADELSTGASVAGALVLALPRAADRADRPTGRPRAGGSAVTETVYRNSYDRSSTMARPSWTGSSPPGAVVTQLVTQPVPERTNGLVNSFRRSSDQAVRLWAILGSNQ
jgi:hypothetical protein